jgi:hypothetical protein
LVVLAAAGFADSAADFDFAGGEEDGGGRDLFDDEGSDGVPFLQVEDLFAVFEADPRRAVLGSGVPGGPQYADVGETAVVDSLNLARCALGGGAFFR